MNIQPAERTAMRASEITPCPCLRSEHTFFGVPVASEVWHDLMHDLMDDLLDVVDDDGRKVGIVSMDTDAVCQTCHDGCECEAHTPGCEHFGCWGVGVETTCPGAAVERAELAHWRKNFHA